MLKRMDKSVSIAIPFYAGMKDAQKFLTRLLESIQTQTLQPLEVVITGEGNASENTNLAMSKCKGDLVKVMYMDDYFTHKNALKEIVGAFDDKVTWLINGCNNNQVPYYTGDIHLGNNKLGAPSCLTVKNGLGITFDPSLRWLLDCDFYKKMYLAHGLPKILIGDYVTIGEGDHQATNSISEREKLEEVEILRKKYV